MEMEKLDDNDVNTIDMLLMFKETSIHTLIVSKCNLQDFRTQNCVIKNAVNLMIRDSFIKFWVQHEICCENLQILKSTIVYGKGTVGGLRKVKNFTIKDSFIKNPEFVFKPISEAIREIRMTKNDFYGVMKFNLVYYLCSDKEKFKNLKIFEFQG